MPATVTVPAVKPVKAPKSAPLAPGERPVRTICCAACNAPRTFEVSATGGPDPKYCDRETSPECAEFGRMTTRWETAARALIRRVKRRDGKGAGRSIGPKLKILVQRSADNVLDAVKDEMAV